MKPLTRPPGLNGTESHQNAVLPYRQIRSVPRMANAVMNIPARGKIAARIAFGSPSLSSFGRTVNATNALMTSQNAVNTQAVIFARGSRAIYSSFGPIFAP